MYNIILHQKQKKVLIPQLRRCLKFKPFLVGFFDGAPSAPLTFSSRFSSSCFLSIMDSSLAFPLDFLPASSDNIAPTNVHTSISSASESQHPNNIPDMSASFNNHATVCQPLLTLNFTGFPESKSIRTFV